MELKERILEAVIVVFNEKGIKFTMDDVAKQLEISKKTIYTVFQNKEALLYEMVDYAFDSIKESERAIMEDSSLSLIEKIRRILVVLPAGYREVDFSQLYLLKEKYPKIYKKLSSITGDPMGEHHCPVGAGNQRRSDTAHSDPDL